MARVSCQFSVTYTQNDKIRKQSTRITDLQPCALSTIPWSCLSLSSVIAYSTCSSLLLSRIFFLETSFFPSLSTHDVVGILKKYQRSREKEITISVQDRGLRVFINVEGTTQTFLFREIQVIDYLNCLYLVFKCSFIFINIYLLIYLCLYVSV